MLGTELRELRERLGLTLAELGQASGGYTRGYLSDLETREGGQAPLPPTASRAIVGALKVLARRRDREVRDAVMALLDTKVE